MDIEHTFSYHPPDAEARKKHEMIREQYKNLAHLINNTLKEGREKSVAITNLQQSLMWANASIALTP
jgi:hypothetical protein